jgi:ribokinase
MDRRLHEPLATGRPEPEIASRARSTTTPFSVYKAATLLAPALRCGVRTLGSISGTTTMITNFGSCCIDNVYSVPRLVVAGETLPCTGYQVYPGGKGLNQSLAIAHAGAQVRHAGRIGEDGIWLKSMLSGAGVDTDCLNIVATPSGQAVIQVTAEGENAIVIYGGANRTFSRSDFDEALALTKPGDFVLIQNEINNLGELIVAAHVREQRIAFNVAPFTAEIIDYPLDLIDMFILNELEGRSLTGESEPLQILAGMSATYPNAASILTLGVQGAMYRQGATQLHQAAFPVTAVDTTGAGDTFTGYFLAGVVNGRPMSECLRQAARASAVCVTRHGAATSIPRRQELAGAFPD